MSRLRSLVAAGALAAVALAPLSADAQQPGTQPAPPGARGDGRPPGRGPGGPPPGGPEGQPGRRGPGIVPGFPPGVNPGGRRPTAPLPAGHPPVSGMEVAPPPKPKIPRDAHGHCPGHGAMDSLREHAHINWWQGLLGVDNDKARGPNTLDRLLWRYENKDDECDPLNQQPPVLAQAINLLVLLLLFVKLGKKPLAEALAKRKKDIVQDLEAARALGDEAEERLARYEEQLENLDDRRREIHEEATQQWEAEKKRILAEAEERRVRMRRDAELRVEQERKAAQQELLREAIEGATHAARELLQSRLEAADHDRLADEYLASVGKVVEAGARPGGAS